MCCARCELGLLRLGCPGKKGMTGGQIAAAVICSIIGAAALIGLIVYCRSEERVLSTV
jgi:hypothetical protein